MVWPFGMHCNRRSSKPHYPIFMEISVFRIKCISSKAKPCPCFQDEFISSPFKDIKFYLLLEDSMHVHNRFQSHLLPSSPLQLLTTTRATLTVSVIMIKWSLKRKTAAISGILTWGWIVIWKDSIHSFCLLGAHLTYWQLRAGETSR